MVLFLAVGNMLNAQQGDSVKSLTIPPLQVVLDSALMHSPLLKAKAINSEIIAKELEIEKQRWTKFVFIDGAANYGKFDQFLISENTSQNTVQSGLLNRSTQVRYYGGIGVKLPISSIISRRKEIQALELKMQQSDFERQNLNQELEQFIIDEYFKLKYYEESLETFIDMHNTLEISYLKAKKDLENGRMNLSDFVLLVSTMGKAKDSFLKTKNSYYAQYNKLQELTGIKFSVR